MNLKLTAEKCPDLPIQFKTIEILVLSGTRVWRLQEMQLATQAIMKLKLQQLQGGFFAASLTTVIFFCGCSQQRYQPAEWRTTAESGANSPLNKDLSSMGTTFPGTTLPGTTLPGTTLPGTTLPGTTLPQQFR